MRRLDVDWDIGAAYYQGWFGGVCDRLERYMKNIRKFVLAVIFESHCYKTKPQWRWEAEYIAKHVHVNRILLVRFEKYQPDGWLKKFESNSKDIETLSKGTLEEDSQRIMERCKND